MGDFILTLYLQTVRHSDHTSHLSAHKGINRGLESHSVGVKATIDVDLSAETLNHKQQHQSGRV